MYQIHNTVTGLKVIHRLSDSAWIPSDEANTDYKEYLQWVAEGNTAEEINVEEV
jgi:hypothetical protein